MDTTNRGTPLVELRDISISFGGIKAVDHVTVDLYPGEVVGLLGHNGAGKSTLIKCLSGAYKADAGEILINGEKVDINSPRDARALNIETIYQTLALADNLDSASNLFLGRELVNAFGFVDESKMEAETRKIMARLNPNFRKFNVPVSALSGGQRQSVAIARAVYFNARILIMDEPTAALGPHETQMVSELIQELKAQGLGIFLIEHDIHNVMKLCDRASVMKNGQLVGTVKVDEVTDEDILSMIILGKKTREGRLMYIGLDLGTSGLKGVLIDDAQVVLAEVTAPLTVSRLADGWSEQAPSDWITAAEAVLDQFAAKGLGSVRAIGLSGQMHGATLLDASDEVLRPCMLWNDTRAHMEAAELDDDPMFRRIIGNIVFPGFTAPKVMWVQRHEPQVWAKIAKILLPKDYLRLWLTGDHVSDMSDASGTAWFDTGRRDWSDDLLAVTGFNRKNMPRLVEGSATSGRLRDALAARWGLPKGVAIAGGGGDNAASGVGVGVVRAGEAFVSLGTSGVLFAVNDGYQPDPATAVHTFCHAVPKTWHQMGVILAATDALNWYAGLVGQDAAALTGNLGPLQAPRKTVFLPYLGGERTPINSPTMRAAFIGLEHATDRQAATRAVLEGVAFAFRDCRDVLAATGTKLNTLLAVGGGSRSDYWLSAIATALGVPLQVPVAGDFGGAYGAARLGLMAANDVGAEIATLPKIARVIAPDPALSDAFDAGHARFRAAQTAIRGLT